MRKPCCDKQDTNKGAWSKQEDQKLVDYIQKHGEGCWRTLPQAAGLLRCGKSCRLRWINYLRPDIKRGNFAEDEEDLIIKLHALLGNRWSLIAGRLPGRTDNEVKNYWNSHLRRKLINMGIDPNNHRLSQKYVPIRHQNPNNHHHDDSDDSATSSASKDHDHLMHASDEPPVVKICGDNDDNNNNNNDQVVSDAGSCLEDDHVMIPSSGGKLLPDLNLDLSITTTTTTTTTIILPPPSLSTPIFDDQKEQKKKYIMDSKTSRLDNDQCARSPALLLYL